MFTRILYLRICIYLFKGLQSVFFVQTNSYSTCTDICLLYFDLKQKNSIPYKKFVDSWFQNWWKHVMSSTFDGHHALSACCSDNRGEHGTRWQGIELANDLKITNRKKSLNDESLEMNVAISRKKSQVRNCPQVAVTIGENTVPSVGQLI